mgnify:CR=1 FL=1
MDTPTRTVYERVSAYEPAFAALAHAVSLYVEGDAGIAPARDYLTDAVERHRRDMGLEHQDLDEVDYAAIIHTEAGV